jgi:hypothetical protein
MSRDFLVADARTQDKWESFWDRRQIAIPERKIFTAEDRVFTVGSCFAYEIKKAMIGLGVACLPDYTHTQPDRARVRLENDEGVPLFHLQHYNSYTVLGEFERIAGTWTQDPDDYWTVTRGSPWRGETAYQDPYRRRLYGRTVDDLHAINRELDDVYRRGFEEATAFFFTFGMTEVFRQKSNGRVVCQRPLYAGGGGLHETEFYMSSYLDNLANVEKLIGIIRSAKPDAKIVMTVSPVPLARSFSNRDVTIATTESKAILRAVLGEVSRRHHVLYFPSYEAITWQGIDRVFGGYDNRHVHDAMVHNIMKTFIETHFDLPQQADDTEADDQDSATGAEPGELAQAGAWLMQDGLAAAPRVLALLAQLPSPEAHDAAQSVLADLIAVALDACERGELAEVISAFADCPPALGEMALSLLTAAFFPDGRIVPAAFDDSAALCFSLFVAVAGRPVAALELIDLLRNAREGERFAANAAVLRGHVETVISLTPPPANVVLTCYFNSITDAQRGHRWPSDPNGITTLGRSVEAFDLPLVVLHDCFAPETMKGARFRVHEWSTVAPRDASSSWNRWYALRDYLDRHEEIAALWMVDSTDTELFRQPFGFMEPATLYVGHEPWKVADATSWAMRVNRAQDLHDWVLANPGLPMLNCGVVGGDRVAMMTLAQEMIRLRERYPDNGGSDNMGFNMLMHTSFPLPVKHGRAITTNFKYYEKPQNCPSVWRHK